MRTHADISGTKKKSLVSFHRSGPKIKTGYALYQCFNSPKSVRIFFGDEINERWVSCANVSATWYKWNNVWWCVLWTSSSVKPLYETGIRSNGRINLVEQICSLCSSRAPWSNNICDNVQLNTFRVFFFSLYFLKMSSEFSVDIKCTIIVVVFFFLFFFF